MRFWRFFFAVAGLFNLLGGAIGLLDVGAGFERQGLPPPVYPFAFQILLGAVMILGIGYLMVAWNPARHRGIVWIGLLTKLDGFAFTTWAIWDGQLPRSAWWQPVVNDLVWAIGFAAFLIATRGHDLSGQADKMRR